MFVEHPRLCDNRYMNRVLEGEELIRASAAIAKDAHEGQKHFFGEGSYFEMHLDPIAGIIRRLGYGAVYIAGGYLHDSKEDTPITDEELLSEGIPTEVVHAINLMAKKGEAHDDYLAGILTNKIATVGKYADSSFNFSWTMLNSPSIADDDFRDWSLEYAHNLSVLRPHLPPAK